MVGIKEAIDEKDAQLDEFLCPQVEPHITTQFGLRIARQFALAFARTKGFVMFNVRKSEAASVSFVGSDVDKTSFPASPRNVPSEKIDPSAHSVVDRFLTMKGDLESEGDIHVKGKVLGNIRCKLLIIEVDALVEGGVEAEEVIIRGNSKGTIRADRVKLEKTANVDSEISHHTFAAEEGARIKGSLRSKDDASAGSTNAPVKDGGRTKSASRKEEHLNGQNEPGNGSAASHA